MSLNFNKLYILVLPQLVLQLFSYILLKTTHVEPAYFMSHESRGQNLDSFVQGIGNKHVQQYFMKMIFFFSLNL